MAIELNNNKIIIQTDEISASLPLDSNFPDLLSSHSPSYVVSPQAKILSFLQECLAVLFSLLTFLLPWEIDNPFRQNFELAIFEDVVLSSSHRHLMGAKTSKLLFYLARFFKKEKPEIAQELKQAARWSAEVEKAGTAWTHERRHKRLGNLASEIVQKMKRLPEGGSLIVPGGIEGLDVTYPLHAKKDALYRIKKEGETYRLEIWARDVLAPLSGESALAGALEGKIAGKTSFKEIPAKEMEDRDLWHALLALQLGQSLDDLAEPGIFPALPNIMANAIDPFKKGLEFFKNIEGATGKSMAPSPLGRVLAHFERYQEKSQPNNSDYHPIRKLGQVQNAWSLAHEGEQGKKEVKRRKLHLSLETLFRYFESAKNQLKGFPLHRAYLREGMHELGETVVSLASKGILTAEENHCISVQFKVIRECIEKAEKQQIGSPRLSWAKSPYQLTMKEQCVQRPLSPLTHIELPHLQEKLPQQNGKDERAPILWTPLQQPIDLKAIDQQIQQKRAPLTRENLIQELEKVQNNLQLCVSSYETLYELLDITKALPLFCDETGMVIVKNIWTQFSTQEQVKILEILTEFAESIYALSKETSTLFFDRYLAFHKIGQLSEYIASLDEKAAKVSQAKETTIRLGHQVECFLNRHTAKPIQFRWERVSSSPFSLNVPDSTPSLRIRDLELINNSKLLDKATTNTRKKIETTDFVSILNKFHVPFIDLEDLVSPQGKLLHKQVLLQRQWEEGGSIDWDSIDRDRPFLHHLSDWGFAIDTKIMRRVASCYKLSKDFRPFMQEAVMDNPEVVLINAFNLFSKRLDKDRQSNFYYIPKLSKEDYQEFLLALNKEKDSNIAFWNILGIIQESPEILSVPECRAILEMYFIDYKQVELSLSIRPDLPKFLGEFFKKQINQYWEQGRYAESLFLVRLAHTLGFHHGQLQELHFGQFVKGKLEAAFGFEQENSQKIRPALVAEYLWILQHKKELSSDEVKEMLYYGFFLEYLKPDLNFYDPVIHDEIRKNLRKRVPELLNAIGKDNQKAITDKICQHLQLPITDKLEIDLLQGTIHDGGKWDKLPRDIQISAPFRTLFPRLRETQLQVKTLRYKEETGEREAYAFLDEGNIEWRIETKGGLFFYKKEGNVWLQYLNPSDISCPADLDNPLPAYLLNNKLLFANVSNPLQLRIYNKEGFCLLKVQLKKPRFFHRDHLEMAQVDDLRPHHPSRRGMTLSPLSFLDPVFLHPLLGFEDGKEILLWSKGGKIKEVELPRYRLNFKIEGNRLVCTSPPQEGFYLEQNVAEHEASGLSFSLLLAPPPGSNKPMKLLVPKFHGKFLDIFPSPLLPIFPKLNPLTKWLLSRFLPISNDMPKYLWNSDEKKPNSYWSFDVARETGFDWKSEDGPAGFFDLFRYALHQTQANNDSALFLGEQLIQQFGRFETKAIDQGELLACAEEVAKFAPLGNLLLVSGPYPETLALGLKILLALYKKASEEGKKKISSFIITGAGLYRNFVKTPNEKHHLNRNAHLTEAEQNLLKQIAPIPLQINLPRIQQKFFQPGRNYTPQLNAQAIISASSKKESLPGSPFFSKNPGKLVRTFPQIYQILQAGPTSPDFHKMHMTLRSFPEGTSDFVDYMEMLFQHRKDHPKESLEDSPDFSLLRQKKDVEQGPYEKFLAELNDKVFANPNKHQMPLHPPSPLSLPPLDPALLSSALLNFAFPNLSKPIPERLPDFQSSHYPNLASPQPEALFTSAALALFFSEKASLSPPLPKLSQTPLSFETYNKKITDQPIRTVENSASITQLLDQAVSESTKKAEESRQQVKALLAKSRNSHQEVGLAAGHALHVSWGELRTAFLQKELDKLILKLPAITSEELNEALRVYFQAESLYKHALFVQKEWQVAEKDNLLNSPATVERLYNLLTRQRSYDPSQFPELLILEDTLGFLMDKSQLEMVQKLLSDPRSIAQAVTGAGKTSVIMPLLGLLKANGTNLVTLRFLDPLFAQNKADLQKTLGSTLKKKLVPLLFSSQTPLEIGTGENKTSFFKEFYETLIQTILEKGCILTDRRSLPLLEAKFFSLLHTISEAPDKASPMERDHLSYLAKILRLLRDRQECIYDEHDKALYPREEIHLALGGGETHPPKFMIETIEQFFALAIKDPELHLKENTQAELSSEKRAEILERIARQMARPYPYNEEELANYFLGESDKILASIQDPLILDRLALTKDLFLTYLPLTLSQTARQKYILSEDQVSVIPCAYTDVPREGSQFDNMIERLVYTTQYHYQKGISLAYLQEWQKKLYAQSNKEMEKNEQLSLAETTAGKTFVLYFPGRRLSDKLTQQDCDALSPETIGRFLRELILPEISIHQKKVSIDAQNQVSMSQATAGISATRGCEKGLHPQFILPQEQDFNLPHMISRMMQKIGDRPLLTYPAAHPSQIIDHIRMQAPATAVLIDGAGALLGVSSKEAAIQLLADRNDLTSVSYFDESGTLQTIGSASTKGQIFSHAQSRGADVKLSPSHQAILLAGGRDTLEVLLQNAGRLRNPDQPLSVAVSKESDIKSLDELFEKSLLVQQEENQDNLYRSALQKMRDAIRFKMIEDLLDLIEVDTKETIARFKCFQTKCDLLVSEKKENWEKPGAYFQAHREIQTKTQSAKEVVQLLEKKQQYYIALANELGLSPTWPKLPQIVDLPSAVWRSNDLITDQQAHIESQVASQVQQEQQAQTETTIQVQQQAQADLAKERPIYNWVGHKQFGFHIYIARDDLCPLYDQGFCFTINHLPIKRRGRKAHDSRQNRLHYVRITNSTMYAIDVKDAETYSQEKDHIYDTKLRQFLTDMNNKKPFNEPFNFRLLAQLKFEDGQYQRTDYTDDEWEGLQEWLKDQIPVLLPLLKDYFLNDILKNRPADQQLFPQSALAELLTNPALLLKNKIPTYPLLEDEFYSFAMDPSRQTYLKQIGRWVIEEAPALLPELKEFYKNQQSALAGDLQFMKDKMLQALDIILDQNRQPLESTEAFARSLRAAFQNPSDTRPIHLQEALPYPQVHQ